MGRFLVLLLLLVGVFGWGLSAAHYGFFPYHEIVEGKEWAERRLLGRTPERVAEVDERKQVTCPIRQSAFVVLAIGQSNAANFVNTPTRSGPEVLNFYDGKCYRAEDPMLGANGGGGSPWPRLGDKLAEKTGRKIVFVTHAIGGTTVKEWLENSFDMFDYSVSQLRALSRAGLSVDVVLWQQGEADGAGNTGKEAYAKALTALIARYRSQVTSAPWIVAIVSRLGNETNVNVRAAQRQVIAGDPKVHEGPDTDKIWGEFNRYDGAHFNANGARQVADAWLKAIEAAKVLPVKSE